MEEQSQETSWSTYKAAPEVCDSWKRNCWWWRVECLDWIRRSASWFCIYALKFISKTSIRQINFNCTYCIITTESSQEEMCDLFLTSLQTWKARIGVMSDKSSSSRIGSAWARGQGGVRIKKATPWSNFFNLYMVIMTSMFPYPTFFGRRTDLTNSILCHRLWQRKAITAHHQHHHLNNEQVRLEPPFFFFLVF